MSVCGWRAKPQTSRSEAAATIDVARDDLVAIEQGQRRIRIDELQQLAKLYGTSVNALLRQEAVHVDLAPRFQEAYRQQRRASRATRTAVCLARAEVELENLLGLSGRGTIRLTPDPGGDVRAQAEQDAARNYGIGSASASRLFTTSSRCSNGAWRSRLRSAL